jgi:hypothetical protein
MPNGREFALRAGDEHDGADGSAEFVGHVLTENDGWQGFQASLLALERGGVVGFAAGVVLIGGRRDGFALLLCFDERLGGA